MIVSKLTISGFRGIRQGEVNFSKLTVLIGPNNSGKTTITEALALVLGRDRLVRTLTEHDFTGSDPSETDRILIIASLSGFEPNDPANHTDWFRWGRGTVKWLDSDTGAVKPERTKGTDKLTCQIAFAARFDRDSLETVAVRYFYDEAIDPFSDEVALENVPGELIRRIGFFLVPASRTWDRTISFGSELFRRIVSYVGGRPAAAVLAERARLRSPEHPLEDDENLQDLVGSINADVAALFGKSTQLKLRVTSTDSEGILESVIPHFADGAALPLPARRHGSGLISLQTLLLLMRFGQLRVAAGDGFLMVIEEPELHVPPPIQRKLVRMIQTLATQNIITTHSPTVAAVPNPDEIQLLVKTGGALSTKPLSKQALLAETQNPIRSLLLSNRDATIYALMHPTVFVPEGRLDAAWLRQLVKSLELAPLNQEENGGGLSFSHEVGVVPTADARAKEVFEHLREVHPKVLCLFDGDQQGSEYTASICRSNPPPKIVVRWPAGWSIEEVVGWIVEADPTILATDDLTSMGVPTTPADLVHALKGPLKTDEIVHGAIADAFVGSVPCRRRIDHLLKFLADLAMSRTTSESQRIFANNQMAQQLSGRLTMTFRAFEGPAGTGKTYQLIEELRSRAPEVLQIGQRVLGLSFMHGSRRRLDESFASHAELERRCHAMTIDSFAAYVVRRWRTLSPPIDDFTLFDQVCDACGALLERPEIAAWVAAAFPIIAIDEAQELKPCRLRIAKALQPHTQMIVAADEFQCLDDDLDTGPFQEWFATGDVTSLDVVRRTNRDGLLNAAGALRASQRPVEGPGLRIRYEFPGQVKFAVGHALRSGRGTRAMLVAPTAARWADELVPQLRAGFRSPSQTIPPLPIAWESSPGEESKKAAAALCGSDERVQCAELVRRMSALADAPPWLSAAASAIEMNRRAHGVNDWTRAELLKILGRKANAHRAYGYSTGRGIKVMTIQAAKNRQFEDVVVLWGPAVPGSIEHQRRLLYNAISRAQNSCTVFVRTRDQLGRPPFTADV